MTPAPSGRAPGAGRVHAGKALAACRKVALLESAQRRHAEEEFRAGQRLLMPAARPATQLTRETRLKYCPQCQEELERRPIDARERLACPSLACGFVHWENPTPVVAGLVRHGEEFVLARNVGWPQGRFSLITGFLEKGETPEAAILRETKEELGLDGRVAAFLGHHLLPDSNQLIIAFSVSGEGELAPGEEIAECRRLSAQELGHFDFGPLELTARIVRDALRPRAQAPEPAADAVAALAVSA